MNHFSQVLKNLHQDESGQDLVEYSLLGLVMALGAVCTLKDIASGMVGIFTSLASTISPSI